MNTEGPLKTISKFKQRYFSARELQFSIAFLIVIALLGGMLLQSVSSALISYYGMNAAAVGVLLIAGYALIVIVLAVFFTHRLIGPFKRLEYEMKFIAGGDIRRRLTVRGQDDLHVKNFILYTNSFLSCLEEMSKEHRILNEIVSKKILEIDEEFKKDNCDCKKIREELTVLQKQLRDFSGKCKM